MDRGEPNAATPGDTEPRESDALFARVRDLRPPEDLEDKRVHGAVRARLFGQAAAPLRVARFTLIERVGAGGMGDVWCGYDPRLDRRVAIKLLRPDQGPDSDTAVRRLLREARVVGRLSHPNIVAVFDAGVHEGAPYIAMEYIDGPDLARWLRDQPRPPARVLDVFVQAGRALSEAHRNDVVHRDFKPANVMIQATGEEVRAHVVDFGLAGWTRATSQAVSADGSGRGDSTTTDTGRGRGTPAYMAPEQARGGDVDARSDQFAFCVSLYEALSGQRPFSSPGTFGEPPAEATGRLPSRLRAVVLRGLALDPEARWPSMDALVDALDPVHRRRGRWALLGGVGVAAWAGAALGTGALAERTSPCQGGLESMQRVWNDARRSQLRGAVVGSGLAYAADTWPRVETRIDEYADGWVQRRTEICEATRVDGTQSNEVLALRMACMERSQDELDEAIGVLSVGGESRVRNAVTLVSRLRALSRCDDVEALRLASRLPTDPAAADRVAELLDDLTRAEQLRLAGEPEEASAEADALVEAAEQVDHPPLLAEALLVRARVHTAANRLVPAERDLERAYALAVELRHRDVEVDAVTGLVGVVGNRQERYDRGAQWAITALALTRSRPNDALRRGRLMSEIGSMHEARGAYVEALDHYERGAEALRKARGEEHPDLAVVLTNAGEALSELGRHDEALLRLQRALAMNEATLGPRHPHVANALIGIGAVHTRLGDNDEALRHYRGALAIAELAPGPRSPTAAVILGNIGAVLMEQGKLEQSAQYHQRALEIREETLGKEHPQVTAALGNLGVVRKRQGKLGEARRLYERALRILQADSESPQPRIASVAMNLGVVLRRQGELDASLRNFEIALQGWRASVGEHHPKIGIVRNNMGNLLLEDARLEEAGDHFRAALAIFEEALGSDHRATLVARYNVGLVLRQQGHLAEAERVHDDVLMRRRAVVGANDPQVAESHVELAKVALAAGRRADARRNAERAIKILELAESDPAALEAARATLAKVDARRP